MNNLILFEKKIDYNFAKYIYGMLNEDSGHPLFKYGDPDITLKYINKIKNTINIVNKKISQCKKYTEDILILNHPTGITNKYKTHIKTISLSISDLDFDEIVPSKNQIIEINVCDIIDRKNLFDNYDFNELEQLSTGSMYSYGVDRISKFQKKFKTGFISNKKINISCYAVNGNVIVNTFLPIFLHEYVHFYENYKRTKNNLNIEFIKNNNKIKNIINLDYFNSLDQNYQHALNNIFYLLFNSEYNAKIGNLFGELISYNISTLSEFRYNKNNLIFFKEYEQIKNDINLISDIDENILYKLLYDGEFFNVFNKSKYVINDITFKDPNIIKRRFIKIISNNAKKLYARGMKFVGRYLYMLNNNKNKIIKQIYSIS